MEIIQNILEYYDELYPISESQKTFYKELIKKYSNPAKLLRIGCGTGYFEHLLAREGNDVTGIETSKEVLHSANLRRRNQLMSIRFFQMAPIDMNRFLGKGFYNIISCLESRIAFIHDRTLMRKFFFDCKELLKKDGVVVLQLVNFDKFNTVPMVKLPTRESIRAKLFSEVWTKSDGSKLLNQNVETGNGKVLPVIEDAPVYAIKNSEIQDFAKEAGFKKVDFFADYDKNPFTGSEDSYIALLQ